jgi:hypothetical protein
VPQKKDYNRKKRGYFGELGEGAHVTVKFLQTAISKSELDNITLIQNIPGSELWDVRDLFQRDVDEERVTRDILPYLQDTSKVKFFNPLTLIMLPLAPGADHVDQELTKSAATEVVDGAHKYISHERTGFFRFRVHEGEAAFSQVEWNDQTVRIVAVDGQHRLSALKRWKNDPQRTTGLDGWTIPVVLLGMFASDASLSSRQATLLEVVRKTFVYINSKATTVNVARRILLDDESINAVCVQELIQSAHANDVRRESFRDTSQLPLLFFDWRGDTENGKRRWSPGAVKTTEEVYSWFEQYICGSDGSLEQRVALALEDLVPPLQSLVGTDSLLTHEDASRVRNQYHKTIGPALQTLLEGFIPYREYVFHVRNFERAACAESDLATHAFDKLRFGSHRASRDLSDGIDLKYRELVNKLTDLKGSSFDELLARDIGMRAVMQAFGSVKAAYDTQHEVTSEWDEYASWFLSGLNPVYAAGWFRSFSDCEKEQQDVLTHICFDPSGGIIHYKLGQQAGALGAVIGLLVSYSIPGSREVGDMVWDEVSDALQATLFRGHKKFFKSQLRDTWRGTSKELEAEAKKRADIAAPTQLDAFSDLLDKL